MRQSRIAAFRGTERIRSKKERDKMKQQKEEKGLSRFITISGEKKGRMALSVLLATLSAVLQMVPLWSIFL